MSSPELTSQHAVRLPKAVAMTGEVTVHPQVSIATVADDDQAAADAKHDENPLWVMAIVFAMLCGVAAIVIAFS